MGGSSQSGRCCSPFSRCTVLFSMLSHASPIFPRSDSEVGFGKSVNRRAPEHVCLHVSSLCARHAQGERTRVASVREHTSPLSCCKLWTQTASPLAGVRPRPTRILSMSALVLCVPRKEMTEKDKKCLHLAIWSWCPWRSSSHKTSIAWGRRR